MSKLAKALVLPDSYFNTPYVRLTIPSWGAQTISNPSKEKQIEVPQLTYTVRYATAELSAVCSRHHRHKT